MRFYTQQHQFYCGIDLHARTMHVCIMNNEGKILTHKNMATTAENLIDVIEPYRSDAILVHVNSGRYSTDHCCAFLRDSNLLSMPVRRP